MKNIRKNLYLNRKSGEHAKYLLSMRAVAGRISKMPFPQISVHGSFVAVGEMMRVRLSFLVEVKEEERHKLAALLEELAARVSAYDSSPQNAEFAREFRTESARLTALRKSQQIASTAVPPALRKSQQIETTAVPSLPVRK
jgi:hypothetical protein